MADPIETRLGAAETELARVGQRVHDLVSTVKVLEKTVERQANAAVAIARLEGAVESLRREVNEVDGDVKTLQSALDDRDNRATDERKAMRTALLTLTGVIATALIGGVATVLTAVL